MVAETEAQYVYLNSEAQIHFVNNELESRLTSILNNTANLNKIAQALNSTSLQLNGVDFESPPITGKYCIFKL